MDRVEIGDAEAVGDRAARCRPTPGTDADAPPAGVGDEVPHDEEVRAETHRRDRVELVLDALPDRLGQIVAPALAGALPRDLGEIHGVVGESLGQREVRQLRIAEGDLEVGPLGDPQRVLTRLGDVAEQVAHLIGGLQVVLVTLELEPLGIRQHGPGLHAQQGVVGLVVLAVGVVGVVGGEQGGVQLTGDVEQLWVGVALGRQAVVLQLDEEVVAPEDVLQPRRLLECARAVTAEQRLENVAAEAPGGRDEPVVVLGEELPIQPGLVVVPLEERLARELDQVAVADLVLGQQGQVVVELLAPLRVTARVVDAAAARRALAAVVVGHVGLGADDRLDPLPPALLVELERPVHVAVIGDAESRLTVGDRPCHQLVEPGRSVEHRELGVDVEVGE